MNQPTLQTERLTLEPFEETDIPDIFDYASDPKVAETTSWNPHKTLDDSKKYFDWIQETTRLESENSF